MGGLIKCERVNDCLFHKVGGHVFNARNQKVLDWFWSRFDKEIDIFLLGRFAEWEYYNMDKAIEAAFELRDRLS